MGGGRRSPDTVLEHLCVASVVVVANHTHQRFVAHTLALGSAGAEKVFLAVPAFRTRISLVKLVAKASEDGSVAAIPLATRLLAGQALMLDQSGWSRGRVRSGVGGR
jgi:hypothetical protein